MMRMKGSRSWRVLLVLVRGKSSSSDEGGIFVFEEIEWSDMDEFHFCFLYGLLCLLLYVVDTGGSRTPCSVRWAWWWIYPIHWMTAAIQFSLRILYINSSHPSRKPVTKQVLVHHMTHLQKEGRKRPYSPQLHPSNNLLESKPAHSISKPKTRLLHYLHLPISRDNSQNACFWQPSYALLPSFSATPHTSNCTNYMTKHAKMTLKP